MKINRCIRIISIIAVILTAFTSASFCATTIGGPYPEGSITQPILTEPFLGMGSGHGPLANSIQTIFWNPAGLGRVKEAEADMILAWPGATQRVNKSYEKEDALFNMDDDGHFKGSASFTDDPSDTTDPFGTAKKRTIAPSGLSQSFIQGITFQSAFNAAPWLTMGVSVQSQTAGNLNISGNVPTITRMDMQLRNVTDYQGSGITINNNGNLTYSYTPSGGTPYSYTTADPLWEGFLEQSTSIPLQVNVECRNNVNLDSNMTITGAGEYNKIFYGLNITPVNAKVNIDNYVYAGIDPDASDPYFYTPNFNPEDQADASSWLMDPQKYGAAAGYKKQTMNIPAGETVAEGRYRGFFEASALRMDLGLQYDINDAMTISIMAQNFNGAALDLKGTGIATYAYHRISTEGAESIIDPSQSTDLNFIGPPQAIENTEDWFLAPSTNITLPKKLCYGFAFKKPLIFSINYEQWQTPLKFSYEDENKNQVDAVISNINLIRIGNETQLFILPLWFRFGTALMLKPAASDTTTQQKIDDIYKNIPIIPTELDLGFLTRIHKTEVGLGFGVNAMGALSIVQADSLNQDMGQIVHYGLYAKQDDWSVSYQAIPDIAATAASYANKRSADPNAEFKFEDIKLMSTLTIGYRF